LAPVQVHWLGLALEVAKICTGAGAVAG
jgi:hypothetical protein